VKTYILYTTSKSNKVQAYADVFARAISKTEGRGEVKIKVAYKRPFKVGEINYRHTSDGDTVFNWNWFRQQFPKDEYDGVIFHFNDTYKKRWGIDPRGQKHTENKDYPEFWLTCDIDDEFAPGYDEMYVEDMPVTQFLRLLFHEHAHFDEDLDNDIGNLLTQTSVHDFDYRQKKIHLYHLLVDYRGQAIRDAVNVFMVKVIKLAKQII